MNRKMKIKILLPVLVFLAFGCSLSPASLFEQAVEDAVDNVSGTLEAETGVELGDLQATADALLENLDAGDLEATAEAALGGGIAIGEDVESDFPIPEGAINIIQVGEALNITALISLEEAITFYREEFDTLGLTERSELTEIAENDAYLVFDGHDSGKAVVITVVSLDLLGLNITIGLEDI